MGEVRAQSTPTIEVVSPQPGETVTSDDIDVQVEVSDFTFAGVYTYFCIPHVLSGMLGTITVQE